MRALLFRATTALWNSHWTTVVGLGGVVVLALLVGPPLWEDLKKAADKNKYYILGVLLVVAGVGAVAYYIGALPFIVNSAWYFAYSGTDSVVGAIFSGMGVVSSYFSAGQYIYELKDLYQHGKLADLFNYNALDQIASEYTNLTGKAADSGWYGKINSAAEILRPLYSPYLPGFLVAGIDRLIKATPHILPVALGGIMYKFFGCWNPMRQWTALAISGTAVATTCLRNVSPIWSVEDQVKLMLQASTPVAQKHLAQSWKEVKSAITDPAQAEKLSKLYENIIIKIAGLEQFTHPQTTAVDHLDRTVEKVLIVKAVNNSGLDAKDKETVLKTLLESQDTGLPKALREAGQEVDKICTALKIADGKKAEVQARVDAFAKGGVVQAKFVGEKLNEITAEQLAKMQAAQQKNVPKINTTRSS